jgi:Flp pilus assembly protein TadG
MVEFSIIALLLLMLTGGIVDFGVAFFEWNAASKAVQQGARLAAVSDPVDSHLKSVTGLSSASAGDPFPAFKVVCSGASQSCSTCTGAASGCTYSSAALRTLVYGRGETSCGAVAAGQIAGMCDVFWRIAPANVTITYEGTGLGFAGRPGGPVPTITLELTGLTFTLPFLSGLLGLGPIPIPPMRTSATGEDLSTTN